MERCEDSSVVIDPPIFSNCEISVFFPASALHAAELRSQQSLNPYESDLEDDDDVTEDHPPSKPVQLMTANHVIETSVNALDSNPAEDSRETVSHNTSTTDSRYKLCNY